jgi:tetratricopeptide (TPR) repeat protein
MSSRDREGAVRNQYTYDIDLMIEITPAFLAELRDDLVFRRIGCGMQRLDAHRHLIDHFDAAAPNAVRFLSYLAQWVDVGYGDSIQVRNLLTGFPQCSRMRLTLGDYIHLRMTEGMLAMAGEDADEAVSHFEFVLQLDANVEDQELLAIANFWLGRCHRKKGEYDSAIDHTIRGRDLAQQLGYPRMAAVMRVLESWLFFQKDKTREAARILLDAESVLGETDDYLTLGNIYSAQGRMSQREGRYDEATRHFQRAIDEFKKRDPQHRNLGRSLANLAYNERLIAQQIGKRIDAEMHRRRTAGQRSSSVPTRERLEQVRTSALEHLDQAGAIYAFHPHRRGSGTVHINRGLVFLDAGEWDKAGVEAAQGFAHGEPKRDYILMARARLLQCIVENAKFEEEVEERSDPHHHAQSAQSFATDAVEFARHTQNRRLLARCYIWRGLTLANEFFQNPEGAGECYDLAANALRSEPHDQLWEELQLLKSRILHSGNIDATLRSWSQGAVGDKSFQQMTEEFAEMIIPKVWEREGRKVSRVATRLSVSPKKVRRILKRAGLLNT